MTKFGRHDKKSLMDLMIESSLNAIEDAGANEKNVDAVYASSMLAGELNNQTAIGSALVDQLGLTPAAAERWKTAPPPAHQPSRMHSAPSLQECMM
jgi:acetyl-CoA acetyltransferase